MTDYWNNRKEELFYEISHFQTFSLCTSIIFNLIDFPPAPPPSPSGTKVLDIVNHFTKFFFFRKKSWE